MKKLFKSLGSGSELLPDNLTRDDLLQMAIDHYNSARRPQCIGTFEILMERFADYHKGRLVYADILDRLGDPASSCEILEANIHPYQDNMTDSEKFMQFRFACEIGKLRLKIYHDYSRYKRHIRLQRTSEETLDQSLKFFQVASSVYPKKAYPVEMMARVYEEMGEWEVAEEYWAKLRDKGGEYLLAYCRVLQRLGRIEEMVALLQQSVETDPQDAPGAFRLLAEQQEDREAKEGLLAKLAYFTWIPKYCRNLPFTDHNYAIFRHLTQKNQQVIFQERFKRAVSREVGRMTAEEQAAQFFRAFQRTLRALLADKTVGGTEFLIALVHNYHGGSGIIRAIRELGNRSNDVTVQDLLFEILSQKSVSPSVVKNISLILSRHHYDRLYEKMMKLLPTDMNIFSLGIPEALANLGNELCVPELIVMINLDLRTPHHEDSPAGILSVGHLKLRQRCCLALAAFPDHPSSTSTLEAALALPWLRLHASVALYSINSSPEHMQPVRDVLASQRAVGYDIVDFLKTRCENVELILAEIRGEYEQYRQKQFEESKECELCGLLDAIAPSAGTAVPQDDEEEEAELDAIATTVQETGSDSHLKAEEEDDEDEEEEYDEEEEEEYDEEEEEEDQD